MLSVPNISTRLAFLRGLSFKYIDILARVMLMVVVTLWSLLFVCMFRFMCVCIDWFCRCGLRERSFEIYILHMAEFDCPEGDCSWQEVKIQLLTASFDSSMDMFAKEVLFDSNLSSSWCRHLGLLFANEDWSERLARDVYITHMDFFQTICSDPLNLL